MEVLIIAFIFIVVIGIVIWRGIVGYRQIEAGIDLNKHLCEHCHCKGKKGQ